MNRLASRRVVQIRWALLYVHWSGTLPPRKLLRAWQIRLPCLPGARTACSTRSPRLRHFEVVSCLTSGLCGPKRAEDLQLAQEFTQLACGLSSDMCRKK